MIVVHKGCRHVQRGVVVQVSACTGGVHAVCMDKDAGGPPCRSEDDQLAGQRLAVFHASPQLKWIA